MSNGLKLPQALEYNSNASKAYTHRTSERGGSLGVFGLFKRNITLWHCLCMARTRVRGCCCHNYAPVLPINVCTLHPLAASPPAERPFWTGAKTLCNTYSCRSRWAPRWDAPSPSTEICGNIACRVKRQATKQGKQGCHTATGGRPLSQWGVGGGGHDVCRWHSTRNGIAEFHLATRLTPDPIQIASRKVCKYVHYVCLILIEWTHDQGWEYWQEYIDMAKG